MSRVTTAFRCGECGYQAPKWLGKCPDCGAWNSLSEEVTNKRSSSVDRAVPQALSEIDISQSDRITTGLDEFDNVLGGGIVPGSLVLLGGEPGIGKSTLLLQSLSKMSEPGSGAGPVLLVSGEESPQQVRMRAERVGAGDDLKVIAETDLSKIEPAIIEMAPSCVVIDSIQTMYHPDITSAPGSVSQVRDGAARLMRMAKTTGCAVLIVGHVTKDGAIAGPRLLEHMVDTVLYFEGQANHDYRILRATKNRFGSTGEIGVFAMVEDGLAEVGDPSSLFLPHTVDSGGALLPPGTVVVGSTEGRRPLMAELQALVASSSAGPVRRVGLGVDQSRLSIILAVLSERGGVSLDGEEVYVAVSAGLRIDDPGADLAVALAVYSAKRDLRLPADIVVFGELSLAGEIRPVRGHGERIEEARRLGFKRVLCGSSPAKSIPIKNSDIDIVSVQDLTAAMKWAVEA